MALTSGRWQEASLLVTWNFAYDMATDFPQSKEGEEQGRNPNDFMTFSDLFSEVINCNFQHILYFGRMSLSTAHMQGEGN